MTKKILMITGDFTEDYESMVPFQTLQALGHTVHAVCPGKESGDKIATAIHDFEGAQTYSEKPGHHFTLNATFSEVDVAAYDALVIPGGRAPEYIRYDEDLMRVTKYFFAQNMPVASVCHGVEIPAAADCVKGRKMATVPKCKFDLEICGGTFVNEACVIDGNMVSGRTFHDNGQYIGPWIKMLEEARDADTP